MPRVKKPATEKDIAYDRISKRLKDLNTNQTTVSSKIGAHRSFVGDLLTRRKSTITVNMLKRLAKELQCDSSYLIGETSEPKSQKTARILLDGTIKADHWASPTRDEHLLEEVMFQLNSEYPANKQKYYRLYMNSNGLGEINAIVNVIQEMPIAGDMAVLERQDGELIERSLRRVQATENGFLLVAADSKSKAKPLEIPLSYKMPKNTFIIGIVASIQQSLLKRSKK